MLRKADVGRPPVPVEQLASRLGVQLRYEPFDGELSGMLSQEDGQITVGVNALHPRSRQRFTVAHELGHLMLHGQHVRVHVDRHFRVLQRRDGRSSQAVDPIEIEANAFAAELLMPAGMLKDDLVKLDALDYEDEELVRQLADDYGVSLQAMIFRLTNLGFIDQ